VTNTLDDVAETDCLVVTGANPAEQHPVIFRSCLLPALRDGATMVHVDPRANATTEAADVHLPVRPGYDSQLLNAVAAAFEALDFCLVVDLFGTETVAHADVVLPGSSWAEKEGTVTNTDRRVMRMRANADLPGDARRDLDVVCALGRRLVDEPGAFDYGSAEAVFEELTSVTPVYGGMSYDGTGDGAQRWPFPEGATAGRGIPHVDAFENRSRTAPLVPVDAVPPADDLGDDQLVLTTGRVLEQFNSGALTRRSGVLMRMRGEDALQIHPEDAERRGLVDGDAARVHNDRGSVVVDAEVTPDVRRGTVFCTFHYADPLVNRLTGDALDPVAEIPEYKHVAVTVEAASGPR
jgi:formate dehydrogenase major subunit